jgi:hypothetical protein
MNVLPLFLNTTCRLKGHLGAEKSSTLDSVEHGSTFETDRPIGATFDSLANGTKKHMMKSAGREQM